MDRNEVRKHAEEKVKTPDKKMQYRLLSRVFFRLLPYQILLIVINAVNGIVDGLVASNVIGPEAMNAIGLYTPMTHFLYALSIMLVSGSQILYGIYLAKEPDSIQSVFSVDLVISTIVSVLVAAALILGVLTGATSLVTAGADTYMLDRYLVSQAIGIPPLVIGQQLFTFLSLENKTRLTTTATIVCFLSNALLDLLLTVVIPLGTLGLGLATAISEWLFLAVMAQYYITGKSHMKFSFKSCHWKDAPVIIRRGYSGALSRFVEMFRCIVVNFLVLQFVGQDGISAFAASNSFLGVIWSIPFGMMAAARMLFSISVGEEDRTSILTVLRILVRRCVPIMCGIAVLISLLAHPLTMMFYRDPAEPVYQMTMMGFRLLPLCMPLAVVSLGFACYAQSSGKKLLSIVLPITDGFIGVSALSAVLIPLMKMNGLYVSNILNGVVCLLVVIAFAWKGCGHFPGNMKDLAAIPEDFGVGDIERFDISIENMEEVETVSEQVIEFGLKRGIDHMRASNAGVALEEMAGNVVEHGFTKGRKRKHTVDIRVMHKEDDVILRIMDDCLPFNPADRYKVMEPEDPLSNVGIRTAFGIAKEVRYQLVLGMNVLTLKI